jgi:hypothetical protein
MGAPSPAGATPCRHADVVFYSNNSVVLAQRLHAAPSACADYFISVTPAAGGGPRAGVAPTIRSNGPQFHAMPELKLPDWATYVAQNGNDWYAAGVHVRELMVSAGFDVSKGDTWAINEVGSPSRAQMATDVFNNVDDSRLHLELFVDGLYTGDPGMAAAPGLIFVADPSQITTDLAGYKHGLDAWYQDASFWTALNGKVRFWAQETYADARNWGVPGSTLSDRTMYLEDYFQHGELFVQADRKASAAARDFIASTYTPLGNSTYAWRGPELNPDGIGFGFTNLPLPLMQNFVSSQTYALRSTNARFGYAWWQLSGSATAAQFSSLADRLAASIQGSDADPVGACGEDLSWCDGTVDGAASTEAWKTLDDTVAPALTVPADLNVDATGPDGAAVTYAAMATDTWDLAPIVECAPASGEQFPIGTTTVTCSATDDSGNTATASFDLHVEGASEQATDLAASIQEAGLDHGVETALVAKLAHPECAQLLAFETLVLNGERVGHVSPADSDVWITDTERIATVEGCIAEQIGDHDGFPDSAAVASAAVTPAATAAGAGEGERPRAAQRQLGDRPRKPTQVEARAAALEELVPAAIKSLRAYLGDGDPDAWRAALRVSSRRSAGPSRSWSRRVLMSSILFG